MRRAAAALAGLFLPAALAAAPVPFVGCPSDGQQGPRPVPTAGRAPIVPGPDAVRLAYYATPEGVGVLAPRGWHCFGLEGSNGAAVVVAPTPLDQQHLAGITGPHLKGPVVWLDQTSGGTSGRFEVAAVAARMFPAASAYVRRVEAEGLSDRPLAHRPYLADRLTYRGRYQVLFTTPAHRVGLGTRGALAPDALPVDGVEWLHPGPDMDLDSLAIRLPPAQRPLVAAIIRQAAPPPRR